MDVQENQQEAKPLFYRGIEADPMRKAGAKPTERKQEAPPAPIEAIPPKENLQKEKDNKPEIKADTKLETAKETETEKQDKPNDEKIVVESSKESEDKKEFESLELSFGNDKPKEVENKPEVAAKETETAITESSVLDFYNKTNGTDIQSLEDLAPKQSLSEEVMKFKLFQEQTGRGIQDFVNTQRDWDKEDRSTTLREYLKFEQPNFTDEDIDAQIGLWTVTEDDEDELTPSELTRKKLEAKQKLNTAKAFLKKKSEEFATPLKEAIKPQSKEDLAEAYKPYWDKRDSSLKNLNEIKMKLGDKEISLSINQEQKSMLANVTQTEQSLYSPYIEKDAKEGTVGVNTDALLMNQAWAQESIRNTLLSDFAKQVQAITLDQFSKTNRNVTLDGNKRKETTEKSKRGLTVERSGSQSNAGKPLI